jgi:hypothetical protein
MPIGGVKMSKVPGYAMEGNALLDHSIMGNVIAIIKVNEIEPRYLAKNQESDEAQCHTYSNHPPIQVARRRA